ncbi:unnamed protein product [Trichobilharzia szidati]|nr:unnamed protein product [Trichobilharzia szidati]
MTKQINYQIKRPDNIRRKQEQVQNATIYIIKQYGPTFYLLQDDTEEKYKVHLGDVHTCSCNDFMKSNELCIHLCWLLMKRFKVDPNNPVSWQTGLVEREISALLDGQYSVNKTPSKSLAKCSNDSENKDEEFKGNNQRRIEADDICPICQDNLLCQKRYPVTFCRRSCGNSVHIKCMKVWTDHQRKQNSLGIMDSVTCPMCREEFAPLSILIREFTENLRTDNKSSSKLPHTTNTSNMCTMIVKSQSTEKQNTVNVDKIPVKHSNTRCLACLRSPILGNLYRCEVCYELSEGGSLNPFLCAACFRSDKHNEHNRYVYKEIPNSKWLEVPSNRGAIENLNVRLTNKTEENCDNFSQYSHDQRELSNQSLFQEGIEPLQLAELAQIHQWTIRIPRDRGDIKIRKKSEGEIETEGENKVKSPRRKSSIYSELLIGRSGNKYSTGLLSPGRQCLICLMAFQVNDRVRRLPACQHIFHSACIDPWLLHKSSICPIDRVLVQPRRRKVNEKSINCHESKLSILNNNLNELKICAKQIESRPDVKTKLVDKKGVNMKAFSARETTLSNRVNPSVMLNIVGQHMFTEYSRKL